MERETGTFFDSDYVCLLIRKGKFNKASKYLEGFFLPPSNVAAPTAGDSSTGGSESQLTLKIFHDLHLQRYLECICHSERYEAFQILQSDMRYMLEQANFEHYKQLVDLLSSDRIP